MTKRSRKTQPRRPRAGPPQSSTPRIHDDHESPKPHLGSVERSSPSWFTLGWRIVAGVGTVLGLVLGVPKIAELIRNRTPMALEMSFYRESDKGPELVTSGNLDYLITSEDLKEGRIRFPLRLAFRNLERQNLNIQRVEVLYDSSLDVRPGGRRLIPLTKGVLACEHSLRILPPLGPYTPLEEIDEITVPMRYVPVEVMAWTKDRVPVYTVTMVIMDRSVRFSDRRYDMTIVLYPENRPPARGGIHLVIPADLKWLWPPESVQITQGQLSGRDTTFWLRCRARMRSTRPAWRRRDPQSGDEFVCWRYSVGASRYQMVAANDTLRRVVGDENGDGQLDYDVAAQHTATLPTIRFQYLGVCPFIEWQPTSVRDSSNLRGEVRRST
jgi:hypothetical protein